MAVLLGTLVVPLDSAVNVDFPFITDHFDLPIPLIQWLVISYTLTTASLMLVCGRIADLLGYNRVFLAGCACSALAFVLCSVAPAYGWLLVFRVVQGTGAGLVLSCGPALITSLYSEAQRPRALALYTTAIAAGGALGALLAGVLIARFGWSVVFWARAPASALAFALAVALPATMARGAERFDVTGAILLVLTLTALLLALNRLSDPGFAAALLALTMVCAWQFVRRQRQFPHPIIDLRLFNDRRFAGTNAANLLLNLAAFSVPLLVPFQLARLPGASVALDGALLALSSIGMVLGAPVAGRLTSHGALSSLLVAGALLVSAGLFGIVMQPESIASVSVSMLVQGIGQGVFQVAYFDFVTATIPVRNRGVAGSLGMLTRTLGIVSGASVLMLTFQTVSGTPDSRDGFLAGFRAAMIGAATLATLVGMGLLRFPARARNT